MTREEMMKDLGMTMPKEGQGRNNQSMVYLMMTKDGKTPATFRVPAAQAKEFADQKRKEGWKDYSGK